jgi:hypothetical protein
MNILKPPIRPAINPDESPLGYLKRLSSINSYKNYAWLLRNISHQRYLKEHQLLSLIKAESWTGADNYINSQLVTEFTNFFQMSPFVRVCPLCLHDSNYWRNTWHLKVSCCCTTHKIWLVDRCPTCAKQLKRRSKAFVSCNCGEWLGNATPTPAPDSVVTMQLFIESETSNTLGSMALELLPTENWLTLEQRIRLIEVVARRVPNYTNFRRGTNSHLDSFDTAKDAMTDTANALFTGVNGFIAFLYTLNDMGTDNTTHSYCRLALFNKDFDSFLSDDGLTKYKDVTRHFINVTMRNYLNYHHRLFSEKTRRGDAWVSIEQAEIEFSIPIAKLKDLHTLGMVDAHIEGQAQSESILLYRPHLEARIHWIREM